MRNRMLGLVGLALCSSLAAADRIPVEDFARAPKYSHLTLSPDGVCYAFVHEVRGARTLFFADRGDMKPRAIGLGEVQRATFNGAREISAYRWVGPRRVVYDIVIGDLFDGGMGAIDRDLKVSRPLTGEIALPRGLVMTEHDDYAWEFFSALGDDANVLLLDRHEETGRRERLFPDVVAMNTRGPVAKVVLKNPGNVTDWEVDPAGDVLLGIVRDGEKKSYLVRERTGAPWRSLELPQPGGEPPRFVGGTKGFAQTYVAALNEHRRWSLAAFDLKTGRIERFLFGRTDVDVTLVRAEAEVIWSPGGRRLLGLRYQADLPKAEWFEPEWAARQTALDAALPGLVNRIGSVTTDERTALVFSSSDRDPGSYFLYDAATQSLEPVCQERPWLDPKKLAPMFPVKFAARDGLPLNGYLTYPLDRPRNFLPLVVLPHGGPWVRDTWGFDPLVQFLANRGCAVLQVNYRGSAGYGQGFSEAGRRQIGRAIQQDIEDATRWAITRKIADPAKVAIVGGSFGGYAALFALGQSPGLYRCGVSINGVTDWFALFRELADPEDVFARNHWVKEIGDPETDETALREMSPVNFAERITAPVLVVQGLKDRRVPPRQAKKMVEALTKNGHPPTVVYIADGTHSLSRESAQLELLRALDEFLGRELGLP